MVVGWGGDAAGSYGEGDISVEGGCLVLNNPWATFSPPH